MDIWVASIFYLWWMVLYEYLCMSFVYCMFHFSWVYASELYYWIIPLPRFNILRNDQTGFPKRQIILQWHQHCLRVFVSLYLWQNFVIVCIFKILTILMGIKWHFTVVLTDVSLLIDDVYIFVWHYWLFIHPSVHMLYPVLKWVFVLLLWNWKVCDIF